MKSYLSITNLVIPAKAGIHPLSVRFATGASENPTELGMGPRLRGRDEGFVIEGSAQ